MSLVFCLFFIFLIVVMIIDLRNDGIKFKYTTAVVIFCILQAICFLGNESWLNEDSKLNLVTILSNLGYSIYTIIAFIITLINYLDEKRFLEEKKLKNSNKDNKQKVLYENESIENNELNELINTLEKENKK